jgi:hypothetical protein
MLTKEQVLLKKLDPSAVASVLEAVADVQLHLDAEGFCLDVAITNAELTDLMRFHGAGSAGMNSVLKSTKSGLKTPSMRLLALPTHQIVSI